jgi:hypothetical protein
MPKATNYGQVAYEAYSGAAEGRSLISGLELPAWKDLSDEIQNAWCAAGIAVRALPADTSRNTPTP